MMTLLTYLPSFLNGLAITLSLMMSSIFFGLILAMLLVFASMTQSFILKNVNKIFIFVICGTPLLVQLFIIYYGLGQFEWIRSSIFWWLLREPAVCAVLALSLNTAAYTAVLLQGALLAVPAPEKLACEAMGMSKWLALRRIILPRAIHLVLPAYSNEVIMVLKSTSLASTITLLDVMGITQQLISQTYNTVTIYLIAGFIYLFLNVIILMIFKMITKYHDVLSRHHIALNHEFDR